MIIIRNVFERQISILEWFLKDHVTLKSGQMAKFIFVITGINDLLKHIKIFQNIIDFYYIFDQINAALVSIRVFKNNTHIR